MASAVVFIRQNDNRIRLVASCRQIFLCLPKDLNILVVHSHYISYFYFYFRRVYPNGNEEKYEKFFENSGSLFQETTASKARTECSRFEPPSLLIKYKRTVIPNSILIVLMNLRFDWIVVIIRIYGTIMMMTTSIH